MFLTVLSYVTYARKGYALSINLDFDIYLGINTVEERTNIQYMALLDHQKASLKEETAHYKMLCGGNASAFDATNGLQRHGLSD